MQCPAPRRSEEGKALAQKYHKLFCEALMKVWEENKDKYALDRTKELTLVE